MSGITNPAEEYFKDGVWGWAATLWEKLKSSGGRLFTAGHGWDGSVWRKLPLVFGYTERWHKDLEYTMPANGTYSQFTVAVPAGYIYVMQAASILNNHGSRGITKVAVYAGSDKMWVTVDGTPVVGIPLVYTGAIVLSQGDKVRLSMADCLQDDLISGAVRGYKMKIAE